jgi:hypothetical protein
MTEELKPPRQDNYEVRDIVIEKIMAQLADHISKNLPEDWAFSLFLYQLHDEQENTNMFYVSSLTTADALQLIKVWCARQTQ